MLAFFMLSLFIIYAHYHIYLWILGWYHEKSFTPELWKKKREYISLELEVI